MKKINYVIISICSFFPIAAFAADVGAVLDKLSGLLQPSAASISVLAVVIEAILRMIKSEKPLSLLHVAAMIAHKLGAVLVYFGDLLDKVLPQRLS